MLHVESNKKKYLEVNPTHALAIAEMDQDFEEASMKNRVCFQKSHFWS